jgi:hypothetical protein
VLPTVRGANVLEEPVMTSEIFSGEFYCVKCKCKRQSDGHIVEANGRRLAKSQCTVCSTNLTRILGKAPSPGPVPA